MRISVIIPTYNERENILVLLDTLKRAVSKVQQHTFSYVIVDDNSPDGTGATIAAYQKKHKDVFLLSGKKEGLGKALLRGLVYAATKLHADILAQMDADLSHDPRSFPQFIEAIDSGADMAVGSRYIPGGSIPENWGTHRKIFSIVGNSIVRFGLGYSHVHDWTGGYRAYKKSFFEKIQDELSSYSGYVFQIAFLHKILKLHANVSEVPIQFTDRRYGKSKIAPSEYIRNVLYYVGSERSKAFMTSSFLKFLVVGGFGFVVNAVVLKVFHESVGVSPILANLIGATLAIFSNFNLNNIWTFKERKVKSPVEYVLKLIQFYFTSAFGVILIQTGTIYFGIAFFGKEGYFLYFLIGTALLLVWNYVFYSLVIWKKH
ncbi:glycosyltransferase [Candidatus Gottesmanbacteria bacterium]|nr:glycosyltransferase [Candidatus Gottesmanbacteria bacterium]